MNSNSLPQTKHDSSYRVKWNS